MKKRYKFYYIGVQPMEIPGWYDFINDRRRKYDGSRMNYWSCYFQDEEEVLYFKLKFPFLRVYNEDSNIAG